ncbi:unnamed protein product [Rodentolepis nana]|uniref:MFAP1 domain-containing protein n=1 Tax=Rodentolepis nana TaxID=102285 RepID=A0A0R3TMY5_RODNA|nr:unnamed protein product [Rodentolepis nana]
MSEGIQCTAGAIPVKNEKGQIFMKKVKVRRYIAGKRPDFASDSEGEKSDDFSDFEAGDEISRTKRPRFTLPSSPKQESISVIEQEPTAEELNDPRIRRLLAVRSTIEAEGDDVDEDDKISRHRRLRADGGYGGLSDNEAKEGDEELEEEGEDVDEEELARRRELIRQRARQRRVAEEMDLERAELNRITDAATAEAINEEEEIYEEIEEEYTSSSSEDEMGAPKLKPVFVRKDERITLQAKQRADQIAAEAAAETKRLADERRRDTLKLLEAEIRREAEEARLMQEELDALDSDDAAVSGDPHKEQEEYELWKVRELKRIRRDREARETIERERAEVERIRAMTEAERQAEFRKNPKEITNQASKGKYKFLQKYFHRGAFFVQSEEDKIYQRDFTKPTLEDHFDKTRLPEVLRVKNFGRAGRTKYTHLVDQDTTAFDAAWSSNDPLAMKFQMQHGGGFKEIYEKPTAKKKMKN